MFFHKSKKKISDFKKLPKIVENFRLYELDELSFPGWEIIFKNYTPNLIFFGHKKCLLVTSLKFSWSECLWEPRCKLHTLYAD